MIKKKTPKLFPPFNIFELYAPEDAIIIQFTTHPRSSSSRWCVCVLLCVCLLALSSDFYCRVRKRVCTQIFCINPKTLKIFFYEYLLLSATLFLLFLGAACLPASESNHPAIVSIHSHHSEHILPILVGWPLLSTVSTAIPNINPE